MEKMNKEELIEKIKRDERERLLGYGYSEEQIDFLNDIVDVKFFNGLPSKVVLKDGSELYL